MMRILSVACLNVVGLTVAVLLTPPAVAEETTTGEPIMGIVELFTSQGCSSCPPADAVFAAYAKRRDIVALSLSVDYWDYIGWKDTLASRHNSDRQRLYALTRRDGAVYTPQAVVNGVAHMNGGNPSLIDEALIETRAEFRARQVPMRFWNDGNAMIIEIGEAPPGSKAREAIVWLALVQSQVPVSIRRGENAHRRITYHNVARELTPVGAWTGAAMTIRLARTAVMGTEAETSAVLLQSGDGGPLIGAAWMKP